MLCKAALSLAAGAGSLWSAVRPRRPRPRARSAISLARMFAGCAWLAKCGFAGGLSWPPGTDRAPWTALPARSLRRGFLRVEFRPEPGHRAGALNSGRARFSREENAKGSQPALLLR